MIYYTDFDSILDLATKETDNYSTDNHAVVLLFIQYITRKRLSVMLMI